MTSHPAPHPSVSTRGATPSHKPPRSEDTDRFLDALREQLGQKVAIVDDFLNPDNDYEEDVVQMGFPDEEDDEDVNEEAAGDEEGSGGFVGPEMSSPSEVQSSSGGEDHMSSLTYSSSSDQIPPPPMSPPPPPPVQFNDLPPPPPAPPAHGQQQQQQLRVNFTPEQSPRSYVPVRRKSGPPPPPPPRCNVPPKRHSLHKALPARGEMQSRSTIKELKAYHERQGMASSKRSRKGRRYNNKRTKNDRLTKSRRLLRSGRPLPGEDFLGKTSLRAAEGI
ncbi:unnamed protein product [Knipowitschia caucasica]